MSPGFLRQVRTHGSEQPLTEPSLDDEPDGAEKAYDEKANHRTKTGAGKGKKRVAVAVVVALAASGLVIGLIDWNSGGKRSAATASGAARVTTVAVVRTDLSDTQTMDGTLGYGQSVAVKGGKDGVVTQLPDVGTTVSRGRSLYRVDDRPVPVFYGSTPLFRTLDARGVVGRDVRMVADNLKALGYVIGYQPAPGTWVNQPVARNSSAGIASTDAGAGAETASKEDAREGAREDAKEGAKEDTPSAVSKTGAPSAGSEAGTKGTSSGTPTHPSPDVSQAPAPSTILVRIGRGEAVLTGGLIAAIKSWQTHVGTLPTGVLGPGDVAVTHGSVRVASVQAQTGDPATTTLMSVTGTRKSVTVPVEATDVGSIDRGDRVTVTLPDNSPVPGSVTSISTIVQSGDAGNGGSDAGTTRVAVGVSLDNTEAVRHLTSAPVQVQFSTQTRKGVLAVPVGALLALSGDGYAVQLPAGRLVAVRTGMFAKGQVEISGAGIGPGTKVVTTS
ncbi:hypothetical protein AB0945_22240 [Streptomyces sp. NPDC005474]|uniref:hypothetical protein n=1 Tax=Streptomyces sp. NPDC005474 TaxID=3154878 RepID=UPI0034538366